MIHRKLHKTQPAATPDALMSFNETSTMFATMGLMGEQLQATAMRLATDPNLTLEDIRAALVQDIATPAGAIKSSASVFAEVSAKRDLQTNELANKDPLTGLLNRRGFDMNFEMMVSESQKAGRPCALLGLDVDHFKAVNDTFGHAVGDEVLSVFGSQIAKGVKETDLVARYGGEEFLVALPNTTRVQAFAVASRLRKSVANREAKRNLPAITVSIGVAMLEKTDTTGTIKARADDALYHAKKSGRNRVILAKPVSAQTNVLSFMK